MSQQTRLSLQVNLRSIAGVEWELQIDGGELAGVSRLMNTIDDDEMGSVGQERERWSFNWTLVSCRQRPTFT